MKFLSVVSIFSRSTKLFLGSSVHTCMVVFKNKSFILEQF